MIFPTLNDRELLKAAIRGLCCLVDGALPARWAAWNFNDVSIVASGEQTAGSECLNRASASRPELAATLEASKQPNGRTRRTLIGAAPSNGVAAMRKNREPTPNSERCSRER
jgi:hypothetical protein